MLATFVAPEDRKHLYFSLNNAFKLSDIVCSSEYKYAGIYLIYKNGVCYYVGQSLNLASRIATHLDGKYSKCDEIKIFCPTDEDFSDFYERNKESQKSILENNEHFCIANFKPVENILVLDKEDITNENLFYQFCSDADYDFPNFTLYYTSGFITIVNDIDDIFYVDDRVTHHAIDEMASIRDRLQNKKAS